MEIQFKNFSKKTKAIENGTELIGKTFEGALFKESSWFLALQDFNLVKPEEAAEASPKAALAPLCDVLFLGDTYNGTGEDLLAKMIQAMHLPSDAVLRVTFDENTDTRQELLTTISKHRPKIVVSLGAVVTNILLQKKEKLSTIHGQLIAQEENQETSNWKYLLMPLFHPEFLLINPNMKRTAWNDLQKIMEFLTKQS
jgi:uracil-DNA glycosylase family 4